MPSVPAQAGSAWHVLEEVMQYGWELVSHNFVLLQTHMLPPMLAPSRDVYSHIDNLVVEQ